MALAFNYTQIQMYTNVVTCRAVRFQQIDTTHISRKFSSKTTGLHFKALKININHNVKCKVIVFRSSAPNKQT